MITSDYVSVYCEVCINKVTFAETPLLLKLRRTVSNLIEPVLLTEDSGNPLYSDILKTGILI